MKLGRPDKLDVHRAWLRQLRVDQGWTREELGKKVEASANYIGDLEHGRRNPSFKLAMRLSELFSFPMERLYADVLPREYRGKEQRQTAQ